MVKARTGNTTQMSRSLAFKNGQARIVGPIMFPSLQGPSQNPRSQPTILASSGGQRFAVKQLEELSAAGLRRKLLRHPRRV